MQLACQLAVDTLIKALEDEKSSIGLKVKASKSILDTTLKIREQELIINRIEALEDRLVDNGD